MHNTQKSDNSDETKTKAVNSYCVNVERAECELVQPRPRSGGLVFRAGSFPHQPIFPSQMLSTFSSVPEIYPGACFGSYDELGAALSSRLDFIIVDTFAYSRVTSEYFLSSRFVSHVFRGGGAATTQFPRETNSPCWDASPPPVDAVGKL